MGTDVTEVNEESHYPCTIKVHHAMCTQLRALIDRISRVSPDIEAARPGCSAGIQALCLLQSSIGKANLLLQNCSESSRFYLAITSDATVSRFERIRNKLVQSLHELQSMVPMNLKLEITQIIDDLKRAIFNLESSEKDAGRVIEALIRKEESILSSFSNSELCAIQFCASVLHLKSQKDLLVEKRSIRKMLDNVGENENDRSKKTILKYLYHILKKHDKLVLEWQSHYPSIKSTESPLIHRTEEAPLQPAVVVHSNLPPEEFKCPLSSLIMSDPVVIASGHTFERVFIEKWFNDGNDTCPTTGMKLQNLSLLPNIDMRNLISRWCKEQGMELQNLSLFGSLENSVNSVSSCNSLAGLHLQMDLSNVSLGSVDTSFNSGDFYPKTRLKSGLSQEFRNLSSSREIGTDLLCDISELPWESQCMAIGDAQNYLEYNVHSHVPLSMKNFIDPAVGFLKTAVDRDDTKAQAACSQLILTGLRASRNAIRLLNEDTYILLSSFLGTSIARDILSIFELSVERNYGAKLAHTEILISILQILDNTQYKESAINILYNLSLIQHSCLQKLPPGEFISRLLPFLSDRSFSGRCIVILEKLFYTEEARVLAVETEGFISAIVELLESGDSEEQEHVLSILLSLCSQYEQCCKSAMVEGLIPSLFGIAVNGSDQAKVVASELLRLLRDIPHEDDDGNYSSKSGVVDEDDDDDNDNVYRSPVKEEKKVSSKKTGFFSKVATMVI